MALPPGVRAGLPKLMDKPCRDCGGRALYAVRDKLWGPIHMCSPDDSVVQIPGGVLLEDAA